MSIYEAISKASLNLKRRLFDYNISLLGQEVKAIKISFEEDIFHDAKILDVISDGSIQAVIRFPVEMPLERYRMGQKVDVAETRTYFFELLPVESFTKLVDKIEKNDLLFFFLEDEQYNKIPYLFQVTDSFGKFEIGMVWKKQYLAPYYGHLLDQIIQHLEDYVISKEFDNFKNENPDSQYFLTEEQQKEYLHEPYKNLFKNPLNPKNQELTIDSTITIQCAFGSINVLGKGIVTPENPLKIELDEGETEVIYLVVDENCQYPSVYESDTFHPFILDKKGAFALEELFHSDLSATFTLDFTLLKKSGVSPIILVDENSMYLADDFFIFGDYDYQKFRPLFYVEDNSRNFISLRVKENLEIEFTSKTNTDSYTTILGSVDEIETLDFRFYVEGNNFKLEILNQILEIENINSFFGRNFYIGYEPERYLNDFIRQIYN